MSKYIRLNFLMMDLWITSGLYEKFFGGVSLTSISSIEVDDLREGRLGIERFNSPQLYISGFSSFSSSSLVSF